MRGPGSASGQAHWQRPQAGSVQTDSGVQVALGWVAGDPGPGPLVAMNPRLDRHAEPGASLPPPRTLPVAPPTSGRKGTSGACRRSRRRRSVEFSRRRHGAQAEGGHGLGKPEGPAGPGEVASQSGPLADRNPDRSDARRQSTGGAVMARVGAGPGPGVQADSTFKFARAGAGAATERPSAPSVRLRPQGHRGAVAAPT